MILEIFLYGFITAFGWWTATHYVIEPHFPPSIEKKVEKQEEKQVEQKEETKEEQKENKEAEQILTFD